MAMASSQQSFLTNALTSTYKPRKKFLNSVNFISCQQYTPDDHNDSSRKNENQLAKLAIVTLAAGVLTLGSVHDASAAKTGGRVGGQAFRPVGAAFARRPPESIIQGNFENYNVNFFSLIRIMLMYLRETSKLAGLNQWPNF
ncbi:hypothetical protein L1049_021935 [Liquidambar formosana]|uniref:Uncharacterized protein n=1 Tax=Liquidambar formosana TaxID=63359 RepID=A0AAP0RBP3_LIQFO